MQHLQTAVSYNLSFQLTCELLHALLFPHLQAIKNHKNAHQQYVDRLLKEGQISKEQIDKIHEDIHSLLQKNFETAKVRLSAEEHASVGWWLRLLKGGSNCLQAVTEPAYRSFEFGLTGHLWPVACCPKIALLDSFCSSAPSAPGHQGWSQQTRKHVGLHVSAPAECHGACL